MNISVTRTCESRRPRRVRRRDRTLQNNGLRRSSTSMRKNALRDFQERRLLLTVPATGHSIPAAFPDLIPTRASKAVKKKFDIFFHKCSRFRRTPRVHTTTELVTVTKVVRCEDSPPAMDLSREKNPGNDTRALFRRQTPSL